MVGCHSSRFARGATARALCSAVGRAGVAVCVAALAGCSGSHATTLDAGPRASTRTDAAASASSSRDAGMRDASASDVAAPDALRDAAAPRMPRDAASPPTDGATGAGCAADSDCSGGRCMLTETITGARYPGGYCTGACSADAVCGARGLCAAAIIGRSGSCALKCDVDEDCGRDGYRCRVVADAGRCAPGPGPLPDRTAGNACSSDDDCGGGAMTCASSVAKVPAPGGYCTQACAIDADCGAGGVCINGIHVVTLSSGICYAACNPSGACRDGYSCRALSAASNDMRGVCAPERPDAGGA